LWEYGFFPILPSVGFMASMPYVRRDDSNKDGK